MDRWALTEAKTLFESVGRFAPDILHIQYPTQGYRSGRLPMLIPLLAAAMGVRVVRTWHEIPTLIAPSFALEAIAPGPFISVRPGYRKMLHPLMRRLIRNKQGGFVAGASSIPRSLASNEQRHQLRNRLLNGKDRLIVFFGFLYPFKGAEYLFEIADPVTDQIVIAGEGGVDDSYSKLIQRLANDTPWRGSVAMTGFLSDHDTADLLAAADAVVLPFRNGGGIWNSSISAAVRQGTPVVATSKDAPGLDSKRNLYFAPLDDIADMKAALNRMAGRRRAFDPEIDRDEWRDIAERHIAIYQGVAEDRLPPSARR
jgi:glycosyltransferase involved in cell wall biosynthesis